MITIRIAFSGYESRKQGVGGGGEARASVGDEDDMFWRRA